MTTAPDRISVKRRRDEDPVEALYIQSKKYLSSTVWTLQGINHVSTENTQSSASLLEQSKSVSTDSPGGVLSTVSTSPQGANAIPRRSEVSLSPPGVQGEPTEQRCVPSPAAPRSRVAKSTNLREKGGILDTTQSRLRRFHLSHDSSPILKHRASFSHGIKKHRKPQRDSLAVFVERENGNGVRRHGIRVQNANIVEAPRSSASGDTNRVDTPARKRPNAGAAERAWRAETWGEKQTIATRDEHQAVNRSPTNWDSASISIAEELRQFAIEQSKPEARNACDPPNAQLKFKPKPPKPREAKVETDVDVTNADVPERDDVDEDGDYIVDTYVKSSLEPSETDPSRLGPLQALDTSKIGILVIEEEQEALWETYAHAESSEGENDSEEEDENAEDFHGNDYPEDEVDTEDDYYGSSYKCRDNGSDMNEYDHDEPQWSDDEDPFT